MLPTVSKSSQKLAFKSLFIDSQEKLNFRSPTLDEL